MIVFVYSILYVVEWIIAAPQPSYWFYTYNALFVLLITAFAYGNFLYQAMRLGYHLRLRKHSGLDDSKLISYVAHTADLPTLSVLIPSYKEEIRTVEQTLLSAALLGYRNKQISVLLDDPSSLPGTSDYRHTRKTIKMIEATAELMAETYTLHDKLYKIVRRRLSGDFDVQKELQELGTTYRFLAKRLSATGNRYKVRNHTDKFFVRNVIRDAAAIYRQRATEVRNLQLSRRAKHEHIFWKNTLTCEICLIRALLFCSVKRSTICRKNQTKQ